MNDPLASLAGAYRFLPGRSPAIDGRRPVLEGGRLQAILRGLPAAQAPAACAAVFTLCAQAHRRTATAAVGAASGDAAPLPDPALLQLDTARDHLRAIALDWPARAGTAPDLDWLREAPLRIAGPPAPDAGEARATLRSFRDWLEQRVLRQPAAAWAERCQDTSALNAWCVEAAALPPARLLRDWHARAHRLETEAAPLRVLDADASTQQAQIRELAQALATTAQFAQFPHAHGVARENGPWTRQRHAERAPVRSAFGRLAARWTELVELAAAADSGVPLLAQGALPLATGEAIAWCEMARGLLFHWVRLDADGTVQDWRVLAPTEWNFHPRGPLARALERLAPHDPEPAALLGAAFDACVPCSVDTGA